MKLNKRDMTDEVWHQDSLYNPLQCFDFPKFRTNKKKEKTFHGNSEIHLKKFMELLWLTALIFLKGTVEEEYKDTRQVSEEKKLVLGDPEARAGYIYSVYSQVKKNLIIR